MRRRRNFAQRNWNGRKLEKRPPHIVKPWAPQRKSVKISYGRNKIRK